MAPRSLAVSPFKTSHTLPALFGGVLLRYVFADGTELHLFMHELFRYDIHRLLEMAIELHGLGHIEMPRPGKLLSPGGPGRFQ